MKRQQSILMVAALAIYVLLLTLNQWSEGTLVYREQKAPLPGPDGDRLSLLDGEVMMPVESSRQVDRLLEGKSAEEEAVTEKETAGRAEVPALPAGHILAGLPLVEARQQWLDDGTLERVRILHEERERYPLIRMVERLSVGANGEEEILSWEASVADHVLLQTEDTAVVAELQRRVELGELRIRRKLPHSPIWIIETLGRGLDAVPDTLHALSAWAREGTILEADILSFPLLVPNDDRYGDMWALDKIGAPAAWDITTGESDIVVAVLDTGTMVDHEDLAGNVWVNSWEIPGNGIDDDGNGYVDDIHGWNVMDDNDDLSDIHGHGTHVGGTMAAVGNNGLGVSGVGMNLKLIVIAGGIGLSSADTAEGLDYCAYMRKRRGVRVVATNHSYGKLYSNSTATGSTVVRTALARARDHGILSVFAAGNDGKELEGSSDLDGDGKWYNAFPASQNLSDYPEVGDWDNVISVANSTESDGKKGSSNYGVADNQGRMVVDIAAPGTNILSTTDNGGYGKKSGTSMSSPHVAGAIGVMASVNRSLGARQLKEILLASVAAVPTWSDKVQSGGRLDLHAAVLEASRWPELSISSPAANTFVLPGQNVQLQAQASDSDGNVVSVSFFREGESAPIATDTNGADGWSISWQNVPEGVYRIYATATDNDGKTTVPDDRLDLYAGWVVIDSEDFPNAGGFENTSLFILSQFHGLHAKWNSSPGAGEAFTFPFEVPVSGDWEVLMWWPHHTSASQSVPVEVVHAGGSAVHNFNMRENSGQFNLHGTYAFEAATPYQVIVDGENFDGLYAYADTVALRYVGGVPVLSPIESWRQTHFATTENSGLAADGADPDGDGLENLLEYAFGLDPNMAVRPSVALGVAGLPTIRLEGNVLVLTYRRDTAHTDIVYEAETTTGDLTAWETTGVTDTLLNMDGTVEVREARVNLGAAEQARHMRVRVEYP